MMTRWLRDAGLAGRGYTIHGVRHSFATLLVRAQVDVGTLQELPGHSDISSTGRYLHTDVRGKAAAVSRLAAALSAPARATDADQDTNGRSTVRERTATGKSRPRHPQISPKNAEAQHGR